MSAVGNSADYMGIQKYGKEGTNISSKKYNCCTDNHKNYVKTFHWSRKIKKPLEGLQFVLKGGRQTSIKYGFDYYKVKSESDTSANSPTERKDQNTRPVLKWVTLCLYC